MHKSSMKLGRTAGTSREGSNVRLYIAGIIMGAIAGPIMGAMDGAIMGGIIMDAPARSFLVVVMAVESPSWLVAGIFSSDFAG